MSHRNTSPEPTPNCPTRHGVLAVFTTALLWWIGIVGAVTTGGGGLMFLTIPTLATIGTMLIINGGRRWTTPTIQHRHKHQSGPSRTHRSLVLLAAFSSALLWWIGIAGLTSTQGNGALVFLTIPALTSIGTLIAALHHRHGITTPHQSR